MNMGFLAWVLVSAHTDRPIPLGIMASSYERANLLILSPRAYADRPPCSGIVYSRGEKLLMITAPETSEQYSVLSTATRMSMSGGGFIPLCRDRNR